MELVKAFIWAVWIIITLITGKCEAVICYTCEDIIGRDTYQNCNRGPPISKGTGESVSKQCQSNTCLKIQSTRRVAGKLRTVIRRDCFGLEKCAGLELGCHTLKGSEIRKIKDKCDQVRSEGQGQSRTLEWNALMEIVEPTVQDSGARQSTAEELEASHQLCLCRGDRCLAGENWKERKGSSKATIGEGMIILKIIPIYFALSNL